MPNGSNTEYPLSVLIIGCGSIGTRHAKNLTDLGADVSVFDMDESRMNELAAEFDGTAYLSLDEALQAVPDIAVIATPSNHHIEPALAAAQAGCDLFVEKPLSNNLDHVKELLAEVNERDLVTMVGSNWRFHPAITSIKHIVEEGDIGDIISARIEGGSYLPDWHPDEDYREMYSAKAGVGGAILDYVHEINYAQWLFGEINIVTAVVGSNSSLDIETEDTAALITQFENGTICEIHVDYVQRSYSRSCHVIGENGTIRWEYDWSSVRRYDPSSDEWVVEASWEDNIMNETYLNEMDYFLSCVRRGTDTHSTLRDGYHDLQVALAAKESASSAQHIEI